MARDDGGGYWFPKDRQRSPEENQHPRGAFGSSRPKGSETSLKKVRSSLLPKTANLLNKNNVWAMKEKQILKSDRLSAPPKEIDGPKVVKAPGDR